MLKMPDGTELLEMRDLDRRGSSLALHQERLSGLVSAEVACLLAAETCEPSLRSFWLAAAECYAVLKKSLRAFNPVPRDAHIDRQSSDSNYTTPSPGQDDR